MTPHHFVTAVPLVAWLLVDALAVYRGARLLTRDSIPLFARPRDAIASRWAGHAVADLVTCPWCVSVYLGAAAVTLRLVVPTWWSLVSLALAYSAVAGFLSSRE